MNFQTLPVVESSKALLDIAFRTARRKGQERDLKGSWIEIIRKKESLKIDIIQYALSSRLRIYLETFPKELELPPFYVRLLHLTVDYVTFKKSMGALSWAIQKLQFFQREYVARINKTSDAVKIRESSRQFYGRVSSILKQIDPNLEYLEHCRKIMKSYPDVKDMFTVCVYGFPNVGKTTLLNKLTGTKAKTAAYAFTTKSINAGYFTIDDHTAQVLDVPGTLARPEKMNIIEQQAELVLEQLATVVIYVFDLSGYSGYSLEKQEELFQKIGKHKKVLVYVSKVDVTDPETLAEFPHKYNSVDEIKKKIYMLMKDYSKSDE